MLLKLALGPVLLAQGRWVRARALRLPEAAGPRQGQAGQGRPVCRILVLGDSSAAGVGVAHQQQALAAPLAAALSGRWGAPVAWQLLASTGHNTADALAALRQARLRPADVLVTALGVNDVVGQVPAWRWLATLDAVHALARQRLGVQATLHSGLPPMGRFPLLPQPLRGVLGRDAARLDRALQAHLSTQARRDGETPLEQVPRRHVPLPEPGSALQPGWMAEDGFHPGPQGYALWANHLAEAIARVWAPPQRPRLRPPA